jgi:hypothetical protein
MAVQLGPVVFDPPQPPGPLQRRPLGSSAAVGLQPQVLAAHAGTGGQHPGAPLPRRQGQALRPQHHPTRR